MSNFLYRHRYYISRRVLQITILTLYFGANAYGWKIIAGDLSSSIIFGIIPLSEPYVTLQMFFAGAVVATDVLIGVGVILFIYGVIGGRFFCSWVCPVNIITETALSLRRVLKFQEKENAIAFSKNIRYWVILVSLGLSFIFSLTAFDMISPIGIAQRGIIFGFGFGWFFLLAIFLFDLFSQRYGWCGHICPLGGFNAIIYFMECFKVCPEIQVLDMVGKKSKAITGAECIKCGRCIEVCPNDAFKVSIVSLAEQIKG